MKKQTKRSATMNKFFNKALMVILAAIMILSSAPVSSIVKNVSVSPVAIVAEAASKKTHLNTTKKSIYIGKKYTLKLVDKNGKRISASKVKWSRSNKTVASVSKSGTVTGKKAGKIKITATYKGKKYTAVITVKSAVSLSKSKVTFKAGETAKKTIKVTCKDNKGIKWKTVEGSGIVKLAQAKKWSNDTKSLYITPTGKKFGTVKIKVYSAENSNSYDYLTIEVNKPYTLKVKNSIPCIISNYKSEDDAANSIVGETALTIRKVTYKTPDTKALVVTVDFEAARSDKTESYYFLKYRIFDKNGYLVESDTFKSKLMMVGDKAKAEIKITDLKPGSYTIEFRDYIGNNSTTVYPDTPGAEPNEPIRPSEPNEPSEDGNLTADEALAMYQKAAKEIHEKGIAGYSKKSWQTVEAFQMSGNSAIQGALVSLLEDFLTTEEDAEVKVNEKGSDDAKNRMPISDCSEEYINSVTATRDGENYIITIVMKDCVNPSYGDNDGLARMSKDFLDIKDVENTVKNDATVSQLIKNCDRAEICYKAYTIRATMTKDGKFVSIEHFGPGDIRADMQLSFVGSVSISGRINFNAKYFGFKY